MRRGGTFLNYVLDQLADLEEVQFRKTFNGVKFFYKELEFAQIQGGEFKLQSDKACDSKEVDNLEVVVKNGKPTYLVTVPDEILSNKEQLNQWVRQLLDFRLFGKHQDNVGACMC